ncbi:MAG: glycosyltransferase [Actinomycetota bacterium]
MRRVLLLIKGLGRGGAEQLLVNAARYAHGYQYQVAYLLAHKNALAEPLRDLGLRVHCLGEPSNTGWRSRLRTLVDEERIDVVHAHLPYTAIGARISLHGERGPKLVYTEHNMWPRYRKSTYWANLATFSRNDHVFAVSEHVRDSIRYPAWARGLRMPEVETLYHGPDPAAMEPSGNAGAARLELGIPDDALVVGTVANFKEHKGHRYLMEAAVEVVEAVPNVRFVLVGVGPLENEIKQRARRLGIQDKVVFAGFRSDVLDLVSWFDVFALPSLHEGLSIALLEAMTLAKPIVATVAGGVPEVLTNDVEGLIVAPGRPTELAHALKTVLKDEPMRRRMGSASKRRAADFDIRKAVARMEDVYQELLR